MEMQERARGDTFDVLSPDEKANAVSRAVGQVEQEYRRNGWGFDQAMAYRCGAAVATAIETALRARNSAQSTEPLTA